MGIFGKKDNSRSGTKDGSTQKFEVDPLDSAALLLKMGKYEECVKSYEALAIRFPERLGEMDDNFWAACKSFAADSGPAVRKDILLRYGQTCPKGKHLAEMQQATA